MIITCKTHSGDGTHSSTTFRSEDFHCANVTLERVKIEILRGNAGHTTPFYTSLSEWTRILPLLTDAPALPQDVIDAVNAYWLHNIDESTFTEMHMLASVISALNPYMPKEEAQS